MDQDILYHLALGSGSHDLEEMFGDVKVSHVVTQQNDLINPISFSVCLHGRYAEAHGELRTLHHGRNRLQIARRHSAAGHQRVFVPLLHVQGERAIFRREFYPRQRFRFS